ncbi:LysR family transcriptional regulator [Aestuariibacter sp. AA17]|uniref:LysR family transcriptional regulator n=1 Tax=Fluctibacter corallii TaxID=2984329 RepID=A0ABT3A8Q6_9ALTE|nr:LysR family transcriptional regulator [Aestuariibacter sp. AA17]MCV2885068.1 LysR family transcriptional regulator [Aestuariibacter sp. AA17]
MDTDGIRLFVIAAELLNISAAGKRLGIAPSVASARLSKLEVKLGTDLFHRSTRKITLSIEGAEFLPYAKEIIAQEDAAFAALGRGSATVSGTLRFASSSTFAQLFIAPILPEFLARYPDINVDLMLSDAQSNLIEGGFDLALRNYAVEDSSLMGRRLAQDTRILCASPDYLKKHSTPKHPDDLVQHQILTFMHSKPRKLISSQNTVVSAFPPVKHRCRVVCDDGASMRIAAKAGVGICMSSKWNIYKELEEGSLVRVLPDYVVDDNAAIWLVYPKSNVLTATVRVFIDYLIEKIGEPPIWER